MGESSGRVKASGVEEVTIHPGILVLMS